MNQDQQPRRWWKDNWLVLALVGLVVVIATITGLGYWLRWTWTGLETKSAWDWLELLIIPIILAAGGFWFNTQIRRRESEQELARRKSEEELALQARKSEQELAQQERENDRKIAEDRVQEEALQRYLDRMQELILDKGLRKAEKDAEIRNVARARTLTVLRSLDGSRKGQVARFLHEVDLIGKVVRGESGEERVIGAIINLGEANLSGANLSGAYLGGTDLSDANLSDADLEDANLGAFLNGASLGADLSGADLHLADLRFANLRGANLSGADLSNASLSNADLSNANLSGADLSNASLSNADLSGADLSGADLTFAGLSNANLTHAILRGANLSGARLIRAVLIRAVVNDADLSHTNLDSASLSGATGLTYEQLAQAASLVGATLPDGTVMTEEAWEEFKNRYRQ